MENWRVMLSTAFNFWAKKMLVNKYEDSKNLDPKSLVKNRSVTAEIMLIWTIVVRTYVDWTNVTMPVDNPLYRVPGT